MENLRRAFSMEGIVGAIAFISPILAPIPSAYFVYEASMTVLAAPEWVAFVLAVIVEGLGITSIHNALRFWNWNVTRKRDEPTAPVWIASVLGLAYVVVVVSMTVVLKIIPTVGPFTIDGTTVGPFETGRLALAILPLLAVVGAVNLALSAQHDERVREAVETRERVKAERREARQRVKGGSDVPTARASGTLDPSHEGLSDPLAPSRPVLRVVEEPPTAPAGRQTYHCQYCRKPLGDPSNKSAIGGHEGNCKMNPSSKFYRPSEVAVNE